MDFGILETAVTLGLIKIVCSLLYFPTLRDFNSVGFCCSCLLIFTDLLVTVFFTLLWLAKPWKPNFLAPSDVIVPRVLLFLDHTYGTAMLLTAPLIAVDAACRLRWPLDHEKWGEGGLRAADPVCRNWERARVGGRRWSCDAGLGWKGAGRGQSAALAHLPGFLCCLLVWSLCGCGQGRDWRSEGRLVELCLRTGGSLPACLPGLPAVALQALGSPSRTLASAALSLLLALNMGVLRGGWGPGGAGGRTDARREEAESPASVHRGGRTHGAPASPAPPCDRSPSAPLPRQDGRRGDVPLAVPEPACASSARPSPRCLPRFSAAPDAGPRPCAGGRGGGSVLTGLCCAAALCLLPPAMAVNGMLVRTAESLAEWSLGHILPASRPEQRSAE